MAKVKAKTKVEIKGTLMAAMEEEIENVLDWEDQATSVTLTDIEEKVLALRQRMSERVVSELVQARVARLETAVPPRAASGQRLHRKGKKTAPARRGSGS